MLQQHMSLIQRNKVDTVGMISSGLCAIHCAALPLLLYFGVIGSVSSVIHDSFEFVVLISSLILAVYSAWRGLKLHGRIFPQLLIVGGMLFLAIGFMMSLHIFMAFGGLCLVGGHWLNSRSQISLR